MREVSPWNTIPNTFPTNGGLNIGSTRETGDTSIKKNIPPPPKSIAPINEHRHRVPVLGKCALQQIYMDNHIR
jgi:hypothetical protein